MMKPTKQEVSTQDKVIAETKRLRIELLDKSDAGFMLELVNTPNWKKYIGDLRIKTRLGAKKYILDGPVKSYHSNGFGLYKLCLKENGVAIGVSGILLRKELSLPDLGYALLPEYEDLGYAHEAAQEVINLARSKFHIHKLLAVTRDDNVRSIKLLEKLGFVYQRNSSKNMANNIRLYSQLLTIL